MEGSWGSGGRGGGEGKGEGGDARGSSGLSHYIGIYLLVSVLWQIRTSRIHCEVDQTLVVSYTTGSEIQLHRSASNRPDTSTNRTQI